jgi:hypothetical protein
LIAVIFEFTPAAGRKKGRQGIFATYRLRIASVTRDYTLTDRKEAPKDSVEFHA